MSEELLGPPYDYAIVAKECVRLFATGETPKCMFFDLQGVIKGPLAAGGDPPPPNGVMAVSVQSICVWLETIAGINYVFNNFGATAAMNVGIPAGVQFFTATGLPLDTLSAANEYTNPAVSKYYGGYLNLSYEPPSGDKSCVTIAQNFGILPGPGVFVSPRPKDAAESVYAFQAGPDRTNIKIKIENP